MADFHSVGLNTNLPAAAPPTIPLGKDRSGILLTNLWMPSRHQSKSTMSTGDSIKLSVTQRIAAAWDL